MKRRIYQFVRALFGRLDAEGHRFVRSYLSPVEQRLFYDMHGADQYHAVRVALTAKELYKKHGYRDSDAYILLIRCALLHDIGRVKGTADIWEGARCPCLSVCSICDPVFHSMEGHAWYLWKSWYGILCLCSSSIYRGR